MMFPVAEMKEVKVAAKQTGPAQSVKRRDHVGARFGLDVMTTALAANFILASCTTTPWVQPGKTDKDLSRDLAACERDAETSTLAAKGTNRGDFPLPNSGSSKKGPSPLEFHDRSALSQSYDQAVERCMRAEGYRQGHPADQR